MAFYTINSFKKMQLTNSKIPLEKQYAFIYRLKQLIDHQYNLHDAMAIIQWDKEFAKVSDSIIQHLLNGHSLAQSLHVVQFDSTIVQFLTIASQHGNLSQNLNDCCQLLKQQIDFIKRFKQLSVYPLILLTVFLIILVTLKVYIFPSFQSLIGTSSGSDSSFTIALTLIDGFLYGIITIILFSVIGYLLFKATHQSISIQIKIKILNRIPILFPYLRMRITFLFGTHLTSLLQTGIQLNDCFKLLVTSNINPFLSYYIVKIDEHLRHGYRLDTILPTMSLFESELTNIMQKDYNSQQLHQELHLYANFLLAKMEQVMQKWLKIIHPIFLSILASLIIFVYLSLMLPMFDYLNILQ
jgi:competence protein ComGB